MPRRMMTARLVGIYRREPVELPHHRMEIEEIGDSKLSWKAGGEEKGWALTISSDDDTLLLVGDDCPYYEDCKQVTIELEDDKVIGLMFHGERYVRKDVVFELPDEVYEELDGGDDDDSAAAVGDDPGFGPDDASTD